MFTTGMPAIDAHEDFARARRAHLAARAARWLRPGADAQRAPRTPSESSSLPWGRPHLQVVPLDDIVGTVEPTNTFDAAFRPATHVLRERWERIALAHRRGIALPPISVVRHEDGYYVADGRHRVSVARALGHRDISAWVTRARRRPRHQQAAASSRTSGYLRGPGLDGYDESRAA
jgi:hypothetical protein